MTTPVTCMYCGRSAPETTLDEGWWYASCPDVESGGQATEEEAVAEWQQLVLKHLKPRSTP
jgi:hypothetical protein